MARRPVGSSSWVVSSGFNGRPATPGAWDDRLLPPLRRVMDVISEQAPVDALMPDRRLGSSRLVQEVSDIAVALIRPAWRHSVNR
jgi:hypothetical protein